MYTQVPANQYFIALQWCTECQLWNHTMSVRDSCLLQVFDLGADGKEFRKVAELTDFTKQAERAAGENP